MTSSPKSNSRCYLSTVRQTDGQSVGHSGVTPSYLSLCTETLLPAILAPSLTTHRFVRYSDSSSLSAVRSCIYTFFPLIYISTDDTKKNYAECRLYALPLSLRALCSRSCLNVLRLWYKVRLVSNSSKNHTTASIQLFRIVR
jgi:hypothetical protein